MGIILQDRGKFARVEESRTTVYFEVTHPSGIIPALHYLEAFPESRRKGIVVAQSPCEPVIPTVEDTAQEYRLSGRFFKQGMLFSHDAYNLVLLRGDRQHYIRDILAEFGQYLDDNGIEEKRKVVILDFKPRDAHFLLHQISLRRLAGDKTIDFSVFWDGRSLNGGMPVPLSIYFHDARWNDTMKQMLGGRGGFGTANLEERIQLDRGIDWQKKFRRLQGSDVD